MENLDPPPLPPSPNIKDEKMARFALRVASWGWGFAVPFKMSKTADETTCYANFQIHERYNVTVQNLFG